ncbi:MAG: TetR/AcrR family transcriptional regulator [Myxococcales bacterium]|nr:TetR/AcrR family transcriptional regulator [Myxococcales bacterium]HIK86058.1 TetR/AcrR family transcriptional regulator [Myxococcales bacterium]
MNQSAGVRPQTDAHERASARRSHATRTAEMRARVVEAVIESISKIGYQRTTAAEIARCAGVTWGAVQHHFGDKDGILFAVLEESFDHFAQCLADFPDTDVLLEDRVERFVDRSWEHFSSSLYRSTFQILLNLPADIESSWQQTMLGEWTRVWSQYFDVDGTHGRRERELMQYTIAVLSGLAAIRMLEAKRGLRRNSQLDYLKGTLRRELREAAKDSKR